MTYKIEFSPKAAKEIRSLPKELYKRIKSKFIAISKNPFHYLEHYEGEYYKIRIGEYRALVDIEIHNNVLIVRVFGHRKNIYKK